jgi:hypothetical protein
MGMYGPCPRGCTCAAELVGFVLLALVGIPCLIALIVRSL